MRVVTFVHDMGLLQPDLPGQSIHGANRAIACILAAMARHPELDGLDVFTGPEAMAKPGELQSAASALLTPAHRGQGRLAFYPYQAIPRVFAEPAPRAIFSMDFRYAPRDRFFRDKYARGPMPICWDTHTLGEYPHFLEYARVARSRPSPADRVFCLSHPIREAIRRTFEDYLLPAGRALPFQLEVVPHGADLELYQPPSPDQKRHCRTVLGLPQDATIALFLGRITPRDKADLFPLVHAFKRASGPNDVLAIVGVENVPGYLKRVKEEGERAGLGDRLITRGKVEPAFTPLWYQAADLFVFPGDTIQETLACTVLEAMACGLPCLVSDWDGMKDTVVHEETGLHVKTWMSPALGSVGEFAPILPTRLTYMALAQAVWVDEVELESGLRRLLASPEERRRMGEAGLRRVREHFAWPAIHERYAAQLQRAMEEARAEPEAHREARRAEADALGLPPDYARLFAGYASTVVDPATDQVRLSPNPPQAAPGVRVEFYDEVLATLEPRVLDGLLLRLERDPQTWKPLGPMVEAVARESGEGDDRVLYHLALLMKRGLVHIRR